LEISSLPSISEISHLKISNSNVYDPGITAVNCHYSPVSKFSIMEEDFQDCTSLNSVCTKNEDPPDLNQFLSQIATQILTATDKMSSDFHHVMSDNRIFKQEVRGELQELRFLIRQYSSQMNTTLNSNGSVPPEVPVSLSTSSANVTTPSIHPVSSVNITSNLSSSTDQVLLLLTNLFTKMANALTEKNTDSKAEWPKYSGDKKMFRSWYLAIMTQLSIAPWRDLYDPLNNDVVLSTTNVFLNEKLYSKLILATFRSSLIAELITTCSVTRNFLSICHQL
jgi:hypothetical protein